MRKRKGGRRRLCYVEIEGARMQAAKYTPQSEKREPRRDTERVFLKSLHFSTVNYILDLSKFSIL
jgi:hypothetical protein